MSLLCGGCPGSLEESHADVSEDRLLSFEPMPFHLEIRADLQGLFQCSTSLSSPGLFSSRGVSRSSLPLRRERGPGSFLGGFRAPARRRQPGSPAVPGGLGGGGGRGGGGGGGGQRTSSKEWQQQGTRREGRIVRKREPGGPQHGRGTWEAGARTLSSRTSAVSVISSSRLPGRSHSSMTHAMRQKGGARYSRP